MLPTRAPTVIITLRVPRVPATPFANMAESEPQVVASAPVKPVRTLPVNELEPNPLPTISLACKPAAG